MTNRAQTYAQINSGEGSEGLFRLLMVAVRRYSRDADARQAAARLILSSAIHLYAAETNAGECALAAGEVVGEIAVAERRKGAVG